MQVRRAGALLAWTYVKLDHDSDDAYLLLEHVLADLERGDGRVIGAELCSEMEAALCMWREDRGIPADLSGLSDREREVWDEILFWQITPASFWTPVGDRFNEYRDWIAGAAPEQITKAILNALEGALRMMQDASEAMTRDQSILAEVRKRGYPVGSIRELRDVPIEVLDEISASSTIGGKVLAAIEGAGMGIGGLVFIAAYIPAIMLLNLRFMSQVAHTYGFETTSQEEKMFLLGLLAVGATEPGTKAAFLSNLNRIALDVARKKTWTDPNEHAFAAVVRKVAEIVGIRLTKRKLAQLIPLAGCAVGAGFNYAYTHQNLETARMMYRKRWLMERSMKVAGR